MTPTLRRGFGAVALGLWGVSLCLPAFVALHGTYGGFGTLFIGALGLIGHSPTPPGSSLGWLANWLVLPLGVQLLRGLPIGLWWALPAPVLALMGIGATDLGFDTRDPAQPGAGQAPWLASTVVIAAAAVVERLHRRAPPPPPAQVSPHDPG